MHKKRSLEIKTPHGNIYTPAFGPDATRGVIKGVSMDEVKSLTGNFDLKNNKERKVKGELQFLLSNTYHLTAYPGDEFIKDLGGLHKFMNWDRPILTDSGGFQVFSLIHGSKNLAGKVNEEGAFFINPIDGRKINLTPETAIDIQFNLGSDIMIVLDDCRHYMDKSELTKSVYRTIEWAKRSKLHFEKTIKVSGSKYQQENRPLLFAVVQGGIDYDLRKYCALELMKIGFDGYGFGGWAINEKEYFPYDLLEYVAKMLPEDKPRYAMGVGTPDNLTKCIAYGYDLFDCVIPTRNGRHGLGYTSTGEVRIKNQMYKKDLNLLDKNIQSLASKYPRWYLHHLFKIDDPLGGRLLTIQNLRFFNEIMNS